MAADAGRTLEVAAAVTGSAMVIGAIAGGHHADAALGAFLPISSLVRIAIATAAATRRRSRAAAARQADDARRGGVVGGTFLVVLVVTARARQARSRSNQGRAQEARAGGGECMKRAS